MDGTVIATKFPVHTIQRFMYHLGQISFLIVNCWKYKIYKVEVQYLI